MAIRFWRRWDSVDRCWVCEFGLPSVNRRCADRPTGTNVFPESDEPFYRKGTWICASFCLLIVVTAGALSLWLIHENKKMAAEVSLAVKRPKVVSSANLPQGVPEVEELEETSTENVDGRQLKHRYIW